MPGINSAFDPNRTYDPTTQLPIGSSLDCYVVNNPPLSPQKAPVRPSVVDRLDEIERRLALICKALGI